MWSRIEHLLSFGLVLAENGFVLLLCLDECLLELVRICFLGQQSVQMQGIL